MLRTQRSIKLLENASPLSFEQFKQKVFDSQMELGDRIVPLLVSAAKVLANPIGIEAAEVLQPGINRLTPIVGERYCLCSGP
ncbi:hypothetical protein NON20_16185 [Synechocystis sp. B12]|nr:hypothetical protein NON20_16185 [Synechocystis sp. B12]